MEFNILFEKDNMLIGRKEYVAEISFDSCTPKRSEVREKIITTLGVAPELLIVREIKQESGMKKAKVSFFVYSSKDVLERIEPHYILKRNGLVEEKKEESQ